MKKIIIRSFLFLAIFATDTTLFSSGIQYNPSSTGGGGASTVNNISVTSVTTFTIVMGGNGDVYVATTIATSPSLPFGTSLDTFTITSVQPFATIIATQAEVIFSLVRSTEISGTHVANFAIHTASFTVSTNTTVGNVVVPNTIATINPQEYLYLFTTVVPTSGTVQSGQYGVRVTGFYKPR